MKKQGGLWDNVGDIINRVPNILLTSDVSSDGAGGTVMGCTGEVVSWTDMVIFAWLGMFAIFLTGFFTRLSTK